MKAKIILNAFLFCAVLALFALAIMKEDNNKAIITSINLKAGVNGVDPDIYRFIQILEIEECEYVYIEKYGRSGITHKGNCKNPFHIIN